MQEMAVRSMLLLVLWENVRVAALLLLTSFAYRPQDGLLLYAECRDPFKLGMPA
jgi:hypothetical protein